MNASSWLGATALRVGRARPALPIAAAVLAAGCATGPAPQSAMLTYETLPEGATLYESGLAIGTAPVTRTYVADGPSATIRTPEVTAVWPSGAKETFYTLLKVGSDRVATIERPKGAPGLQVDLDHAKTFVQARDQDARRRKEQMLRDQARNSERCKQQMAGGSKSLQDDCTAP